MPNSSRRLRVAFAGVLAAAAFTAAAPAHAHEKLNCEERLERIEDRFREIEERRGYEAATEWWYKRWPNYYDRCLAP